MSVFREATKYIHGDKLWSWNPANHLKASVTTKLPFGSSTVLLNKIRFFFSI